VQARSAASVEAILDATIQVLLAVGKERLTTTRVAARAGVSVGTLYQYFPNKSALLQASLKRHLDAVTDAIERVCALQQGAPLRTMTSALIQAFLATKMRDTRVSTALYLVSSDLDAAGIVRGSRGRAHKAITQMLVSSSEPLSTDPAVVASLLHGMMVGVSRNLLESPSPAKHLDRTRQELIVAACSYVEACAKVA
jgi:AcrR family transcriptional regulator